MVEVIRWLIGEGCLVEVLRWLTGEWFVVKKKECTSPSFSLEFSLFLYLNSPRALSLLSRDEKHSEKNVFVYVCMFMCVCVCI